MRLFLLPISTNRTLIYCQRINQHLSHEQNLLDKVTARAAGVWAAWEKKDKGLQKNITVWGNKLLQRIPYEEWGLKSIPPLSARRKAQELKGGEAVAVVHPSSVIQKGSVASVMQRLGTEREALHRKSMWLCMAGLPITAPIALIPM